MTTIGFKEFVEGVRAMSGLPVSESGEGAWYSERSRFDRVIAGLGEIEARGLALEESNSPHFRREMECNVSWRMSLNGLKVGTWPLPDDCLKVVGVQLGAGMDLITDIILPEDSRHWQRHSEFPEIAGSTTDPKLYVVEGLGGNYVELHKAVSAWPDIRMCYIGRPRWVENQLSFPEELVNDLIARTSEKVCALLK